MANFTKQAIKAAFLELLDEKPLNKISVRDIVERCGINRNSFYYHFQDIPSLLGEIIVERTNELMAQYPTSTGSKRRSARRLTTRRKTAAQSCTCITPSAATPLRQASCACARI